MTMPTLTIIILNHNGRNHLGACLRAVLALHGLPGPEGVLVADNASADGSLQLVARDFPAVGRLELDRNLGFAEGNNRAAAAVDTDYVFFLNNDTAIEPTALAALWPVIGQGAMAAGARLVSWDGRRLDFDGGGAAFTGHGHALGFGRPVPRRSVGEVDGAGSARKAEAAGKVGEADAAGKAGEADAAGRKRETNAAGKAQPLGCPTLFNSGAALLVHRRTFLDLGGFDPSYFAYYEDVDLGWRLQLAGHAVRHVPSAVVRHRHGGSAAHLATGAAARLYERNAIATVVKNYDELNLRRILPAALALAAVRAGADPGVIDEIDPATMAGTLPATLGAVDPSSSAGLPIPSPNWSGWSALAGLELDWPALAAARGRVQAARKQPDSALVPLFRMPYSPVPPSASSRQALERAVLRFGIQAICGPMKPSETRSAAAPLIEGALDAWFAGGLRALAAEGRRYLAWRWRGWL